MLAHVAHHVSPVVGVPLPALRPSLGQAQGRGFTPRGLCLEMAWSEDRGAGTVLHPDHSCPLWQEPGPRGLSLGPVSPLWPKKPPAGCRLVGEFPPSLASLPPQRRSARVCVAGGGGTTWRLSKAATLSSASRRL